jgi:hypothetical protein
LADAVGARQVGLHSAVSEALQRFLALVGRERGRTTEAHATGLGALAALARAGSDQLALECRPSALVGQNELIA